MVRRSDGTLEVGDTLPGRGAWLCAGSSACLDLAARRDAFRRALRGPVEPGAVAELGKAFHVAHEGAGVSQRRQACEDGSVPTSGRCDEAMKGLR
ncbi:MAG: YlxR family protein [Actinomycetota bacterium]|nr:YlxR family protein [Actinomycetota bacterium]